MTLAVHSTHFSSYLNNISRSTEQQTLEDFSDEIDHVLPRLKNYSSNPSVVVTLGVCQCFEKMLAFLCRLKSNVDAKLAKVCLWALVQKSCM